MTLLMCCRDSSGKTPYIAASDKEVRNEFRRFVAAYPDMYDYTAAQVQYPYQTELF